MSFGIANRAPSLSNNSDEENEDMNVKGYDFVSFPTLPDVEVEQSKTLGKIFSNTLRKVTTNASTLVHNYSPQSRNTSEARYHEQIPESPIRIPTLTTKIVQSDMNKVEPNRLTKEKTYQNDFLRPTTSVKENIISTDATNKSDTKDITVLSEDSSKSSMIGKEYLLEEDQARVSSDNRSLLFSTMKIPKLHAPSLNRSTNSVMNINAVATTETKRTVEDYITPSAEVDSISQSQNNNERGLDRITSMFNNLPNDFEISEDSASDLDSINVTSAANSSHHLKDLSNSDSMLIGGIKSPSYNLKNQDRKISRSPTLSSFRAIRNKDEENKVKKKSSNLSNVIFDNAKVLIGNNIVNNLTSSASTIKSSTKKKQKEKPKKISENPLKNGGIPKKYWMNDAFVSECLNCFKQFTAFRRKHHCRFCGQIFCSECTLFISYRQHREERKGDPRNDKKSYSDKLRVCKPCYSDVIVYLSDDSSSSSLSNSDSEMIEHDDGKPVGEIQSKPMHPLSRIRSKSINNHLEPSEENLNKSRNDPYPSILEESSIYSRNNHLFLSPNNESTSLRTPYAISKNENGKTMQKQAPQLAIPTTRMGEAVEIPIPTSSFNNKSSFANHSLTDINGNNEHINSSVPIIENYGNKAWFKSYTNFNNFNNLGKPDITTSGSFENISQMYNNFIGKKSQNKYSLNSSTEKDFKSFNNHKNRINEVFSTSDDSEIDEGQEEDIESDNEDEKVMSLYTLLNHVGYNNSKISAALSPRTSSSIPANVVPTLGEFPLMITNEKLYPRMNTKDQTLSPFATAISSNSGSTLFNNSGKSIMDPSYKYLDERPRAESIRSRERAHASLIRMRSRRKGNSLRDVSILTQNNNRLPVQDSSTFFTHSSPLIASDSPSQSPNYLLGNHSSNVNKEVNNAPDSPKTLHLVDTNGSSPTRNSKTRNSELIIDGTSALDISFLHDNNLHDYNKSALSDFISDTNPQNAIYDRFLESILIQCLDDCDIQNSKDKWLDKLKNILSNVSSLKLTDTLDIKQYVKIKKILGGRIEDTSLIDGLFMTKNIDSKKMSTSIDNPKIALLMFPIEYLKQKEQFISLRIVNSQQSVYITNLVSRLISLKPDIIVVGESVCGLGEKLLEEANITVISNCKPQVIERISRYTKADIFQSINDLFFKKGWLGTCKKFEIKRYHYENEIKTFAFFTGNDISSGFTISLRGGDEETLNSIKYTAETLIPGVLNSIFEKSYLSDQCLQLKEDFPDFTKNILQDLSEKRINSKELSFSFGEEGVESQVILDHNDISNFVTSFYKRKITFSPIVRLELPQAIMNVIVSYNNLYSSYQIDKQIQLLSSVDKIDKSWLDELRLDIDIAQLHKNESVLLDMLKNVSQVKTKYLYYEYLSRARIWSNCSQYSSYQLYPVFHRSIHLLYSSVSIKYATPCTGPNTIVVEYYTDNDKCLGLFLDQIFHESSKMCDECGDSLLNHYKTYVHGSGKLDFIIEKFENLANEFEGKNQRVMWSYCKECNYSSPIHPMSDETYYLSIGKFFELNFWGNTVIVNDSNKCEHNFFKSYVRYFGFNDMAVRMEYSSIDTYEISVPKKLLEFMPQTAIELKIESFNDIKLKTSNLFLSISKRLNRVKVDTFDKAEDGLRKIEELKNRLEDQVKGMESKTLEIYNSTRPTNHLSLNPVLRDLQELAVDWDNEFNEFEQKFLPSENEITNMTQFHLRNFLMDKYNNDTKNKEVDLNDIPKQENEIENEDEVEHESEDEKTDLKHEKKNIENEFSGSNKLSSMIESPSQKDDREIENVNQSEEAKDYELTKSINSEESKEIDKVNAPNFYQQSNIIEKIHKMEQLLESERNGNKSDDLKRFIKSRSSLSHKNSETSLLPGQSQNKVYQLANFFNQMNFDQISREFKKQRELELQKKMNKFKAIPIVESKPIVEIYDKIEDVVDVNDEDKVSKVPASRSKNTKVEGSKSIEFENHKEESSIKDLLGVKNETNSSSRELSNSRDDLGSKEDSTNKIEIPQPEKQSLLKSLTNFWADRSATLWDPLDYPLDSNEHTFADSDVIVREDEPSSLVAFCLSSNDYKQKIVSMRKSYDPENDKFEINESNNEKLINFTKIEKKFKKKFSNLADLNELERTMIKNKSNHLKYQYLDGTTHLSCKIFYSEQFEAFRKACGNEDSFIQSLSRCIKWQSSGGKSGSNFLKTLDDRYILKELTKSELESFVSIAPFYFKYISQSTFNTLTTALAKIFGFYQIEIRNSITGKTFKMDFLIMENLFYNRKPTRIFDLKGSMRNRHVKQTGKENEVLLDENMIEYIYESPLFVKEHSKKLLRGSLFNDTSFLSAMDVMDYSLVIGIDDTSKKLHIGIIDWLRTFTWDKKVENWVKGNNLIGKKKKDPTIVTPKQYRIRFREAMERYILEVPDVWYEGSK